MPGIALALARVMYAFRVTLQIVASHTDDSRGVIYHRKMFIVVTRVQENQIWNEMKKQVLTQRLEISRLEASALKLLTCTKLVHLSLNDTSTLV